METTKKYSYLYEQKEGIYFHFKRYVYFNILPFFISIFLILNAILLISFGQWSDSNK